MLLFIITIIHWILISFMLLAPFSNIAPILILHITTGWSLLVHWIQNNDICCLSLLESQLRGIDYRQGFLHQFISPVYKITNKTISQICYTIVIFTMMISFYNLLETSEFKKSKECYSKNGSFLECLEILFPKNL